MTVMWRHQGCDSGDDRLVTILRLRGMAEIVEMLLRLRGMAVTIVSFWKGHYD